MDYPLILFSEPREESITVEQLTVFISHQVLDLLANEPWTSQEDKITFRAGQSILYCGDKMQIRMGERVTIEDFKPGLKYALKELSICLGESDTWKPIRIELGKVDRIVSHPLKIVLSAQVLAFLGNLKWKAENGLRIYGTGNSYYSSSYSPKEDVLRIYHKHCPQYVSITLERTKWPEDAPLTRDHVARLKEALTELAETVRLGNPLSKMQEMESL